MEKPLSASALEQGMVKRPVMRRHKVPNRSSPSNVLIFPTLYQNDPAHGFSVVFVTWYVSGQGISFGERRKSLNSSSMRSSDSGSDKPI